MSLIQNIPSSSKRRALSNPRSEGRISSSYKTKILINDDISPIKTQKDFSKYDYRRNKCHLLFNSGLREAKMYEDKQAGEEENQRINIEEKGQKVHSIFHPTTSKNEFNHKDTSLISIDEFEDDGIIQDDDSSTSNLESRAFMLNKGKIHAIKKFRPSTAAIVRDSSKTKAKRVRPLTSNKYK
mmetsp:Transcript_23845/g.21184  ORF Transcript_23845/g.21184 Transcript_23845/m.21184 type:complete len:183 (-) Transcript_23845:500-1048(-)